MEVLVKRYKIEEVLDWESRETLRQTLTDQMESELELSDVSGRMEISVEGDEFVVRFIPD